LSTIEFHQHILPFVDCLVLPQVSLPAMLHSFLLLPTTVSDDPHVWQHIFLAASWEQKPLLWASAQDFACPSESLYTAESDSSLQPVFEHVLQHMLLTVESEQCAFS